MKHLFCILTLSSFNIITSILTIITVNKNIEHKSYKSIIVHHKVVCRFYYNNVAVINITKQ